MSRHEATDRRRRGPAWRRTLLVVGAILGTACIVMGIVAVAFDARALIFRSGSMAPAIDTGALAFARSVDATDLNVGDIVSVENQEGVRVTHRIVEIEHDDDQATMSLKGDDNSVVDAQTYRVSSADRVLFAVPKAGYVVSFLTGPVGLFALGLYAAFLLWVLFGGGRTGPTSGGTHRGSRAPTVIVAAVIATTWGASAGAPQPTHASWSDSATAASGALQAHYVQPIDSLSCTGSGGLGELLLGYFGQVNFTFPHKNTMYDYTVRVYDASQVQRGPDIPVSSGTAPVGSTLTYTLTASDLRDLLISLGGQSYVRIYSNLKSPNSAWISQTYREYQVQSLAVVLSLGVRCGPETTTNDAAGPTIGFSAPTNGVNADAGDYRDVVRDVCGRNRPGCGTVTDPSGVASVSYQLKRVRSNGTEYFHASSGAGGIWTSDAEFESAAVSSGAWEFDGLITTAYFDWNENMQFTLTIRAVDHHGNVSLAAIDFVLH